MLQNRFNENLIKRAMYVTVRSAFLVFKPITAFRNVSKIIKQYTFPSNYISKAKYIFTCRKNSMCTCERNIVSLDNSLLVCVNQEVHKVFGVNTYERI